MSRLWRDRVLIALAPSAAALVRLERTPRQVVAEHRSVACDPATGPEPWRGAAAALSSLSASLGGRRADVTVVLSNHFVRYAVVHGDPALDGDAEDLAYAGYCFAKVHGERSKAWQVRLDRGGGARVASAVDEGLLQAMRSCFKPGAGARLVSIQPYLMSAFNRWRRQLPAPAAALLLVEPGRACLARVENGRWSSVHGARGDFAGAAEWERFLDRECQRAPGKVQPAEVLVHAPSSATAPAAPAGRWRFKSVDQSVAAGVARHADPYLAIALCAL